ncbi:MAG TPA: signal recognition particle protein [Firmicutes bacterium]|nr:signal recognition particle protein [Bacillota bacterium]
MAFELLSKRLGDVFKRLRGKGKLSESDVQDALRQLRIVLLEADVNYKIVKDFLERVKDRAVGAEVLESLTPGLTVTKIVREELIKVLGEAQKPLQFNANDVTVFMLVGLQGSGKTTTAAKLARLLKKRGKNPLLVACDVYRPAAVEQLKAMGAKCEVDVYCGDQGLTPEEIALSAVRHAVSKAMDVVILDTAGRLHVDEEMMEEAARIKALTKPTEVLLVADAMTGQEAVNVASSFDSKVGITGVILTKMDSDARGGAALSMAAATGKPIKFVGMGEKVEALEPFYPDRMASRILGMGDALTFIEKAEAAFGKNEAIELERKMARQQFTLEDFLEQMKGIKKMGPLNEVLSMIPGFNKLPASVRGQIDESELKRVEAIILSMTREERANPSIINASRRRRIAAGSGTSIQDVNRLLKQFEQARAMIKQVYSKGKLTKLLS